MLILGIETSCDETGLALYDTDQGLLDQVLYSQVTCLCMPITAAWYQSWPREIMYAKSRH